MKGWDRPELTVLSRGTTGEAILTQCKNADDDFWDSLQKSGCLHSTYLGCKTCQTADES